MKCELAEILTFNFKIWKLTHCLGLQKSEHPIITILQFIDLFHYHFFFTSLRSSSLLCCQASLRSFSPVTSSVNFFSFSYSFEKAQGVLARGYL